MIAGVIDDRGLPIIQLSIAGRQWIAVLDTGFNGDVEIPYALGVQLDAQYLGTSHSQLAAGQVAVEESYELDFPFDGDLVPVEATFVSGDEILIGTRLLRNHRLEIDFFVGTVALERVTA